MKVKGHGLKEMQGRKCKWYDPWFPTLEHNVNPNKNIPPHGCTCSNPELPCA